MARAEGCVLAINGRKSSGIVVIATISQAGDSSLMRGRRIGARRRDVSRGMETLKRQAAKHGGEINVGFRRWAVIASAISALRLQ